MAKVSIIVPIYKVEAYLNKCVDSILAQTFTDFELILVDDGSPDNCPQICDDYAKKDPRIHVIHKKNGGLSDARNAGIDWAFANSDSEWLAFVDSDDWIGSTYLEKLYAVCVDNNADIGVCDFHVVNESYEVLEDVHDFPSETVYDKKQIMNLLYYNWRVAAAWCKIYRKSVFDGIRYDVGKLHEDEFIIHKLFFASNRTVFMNDRLYYYLLRSNSITGLKSDKLEFDSLEAHIKRYWFCKERDLPIDPRMFTNEYLYRMMKLSKRATRKNGYKKIIRKYYRLFIKERKLGGICRMIKIFCRRLFEKK